MYNLCTRRFLADYSKKLGTQKMMDAIKKKKKKIILIPGRPNFVQVGTFRYLHRKDEYRDDFLAFAGAKQIKTPCSHFPSMCLI